MPELPDLEVFSKNLNKLLSGKTIKEITVQKNSKLNVSAQELKSILEGQNITEVFRSGKELFFRFSKGDILSMHLMLRGKLYFSDGTKPEKYVIISLTFNDGTEITLTDFQEQATPTLNPSPKEAPDALSADVDFSFFNERLQKSRSSVKNFLLDQHIIRGIGNAYADEILWQAGIAPMSVCNKIPEKKVKDLAKAVKDVLKEAEKQIIKTHPDIISGEIRDFLKIHNPAKKHSPNGAPVKVTTSGSRKTYYTDEQELFK